MKKKIKKYKFGAKLKENPNITTNINSAMEALNDLSNMMPQDNLSQGAQKGIDIGKSMAKPLDMAIPGLGTGLGFLAEGIGSIVSKVKGNKQDPRNDKTLDTTMNNITSNPFGTQFKMGGKFYQLGGKKVSEFNAASHNEGGQNIDKNMNPTNMNSKGEIEKKEVGIGNYIFSDFLKDEDGKTFAQNAKKIARKYKGREDNISLNSLDKELSLLSTRNESLKQTQESTKFKYGGTLENTFPSKPKYLDVNKIPASSGMTKEDVILYNKNIKNKYKSDKQNWRFGKVDEDINIQNSLEKAKNLIVPKFDDGGFMLKKDSNQQEELPSTNPDSILTNFIGDPVTITAKRPSPIKLGDSKGPEVDSKTTMPVNGVTPPAKEKILNGDNTDKTLSGLVYGIKGLQTIGHAAQAFQKPDYIDPVLNPNASKIKSLAANRKIDLQSVLNEIRLDENKGIKDISDNSLSDSVRRSNIANTISNTQRAVADTKLKEQAMNMDFRKDEMIALNSLGQQDVAARVYSEDANAKTKANMQVQRSKFLQETVGGMGDYIAKKDYANKSDDFYTNLLNQKYADFGVSDPKDFTKEHAEIIRYKLAKGEDYEKIISEYKTLTGDFKPKE